MEAVGAIVGSALTEPFRLIFGSIYAKVKNLFKIHSNYNDLERDINFLSALKCRLREVLDDDELQHHLPRIQVQDWLSKVEELENNFKSVQSTVMANGNISDTSRCARSLQCKLSNNIVKQIVKAKQLIEDGRAFENMIVGGNPMPKPVKLIPAPSIEGQPTASRNLAEIKDLLRNDKVKRIGVWGMGGVGKTTLIKNLNNELGKYPANQLFSIVIWVVVSRERSWKTIQSQIAERLKLQITMEESEHVVASRLSGRLEKQRSFLLILDDLWDDIDLDHVGIPRLENHTGSKIILTSRFLPVCQRMFTDINFELGRLSDEEAWKLFSQQAGEEAVSDDQIKPFAEAVVKECDGLPLAIIVVGASMREKRNIALWKDALDALQRSTPRIQGVEEKVFKPLKWSYDSLESEHLKSCFLFFCLFPEDFEVDIHRLVQYWLAEGLLDEQQNYEQLHNRCIAIVERLKDSCLLESGFNTNCVKMHDVVRDVGIWITTSLEDACKSIVRAGVGEKRIPQTQLLNCSNRVKRVSFMKNNITSLPDCKVQCLETFTLFLQGNESLQEVPNSFLQGFENLRILELSGSKIRFLPCSLLHLGELRALFLNGCDELSELPPLTALGMLQVLDCNGTAITKLPDGFEKLTYLRQLSLSDTHMQEIPIEKISNLCRLEFLDMRGSAAKWGMGKTNEENLPFQKLLWLRQLHAFYIEFNDIPHVTTDHVSWLGEINYFIVTFTSKCQHITKCNRHSKSVLFSYFHFSGNEAVVWWLINAFECTIVFCEGVDLMLDNLVGNKLSLGPFANLKRLAIYYCCISVKPLSLGQSVANFDLLPNLAVLHFGCVSKLKSLSDFCNFLRLRFTELKSIIINGCDGLGNLLTMDGTLQKLEKVEEISISTCKELTEVFKNASSDNFVPNLRSLSLIHLPALEGICKADVPWQSLKHLEVVQCNMLRTLPLGIQNAESIELIKGEQHWWNELQWDSENSKMRLQQHFQPCDAHGEEIHQATRS